MKLKYLRLDRKNRSQYENSIAELEKIASYPLGEDRFTIDHGSDYFAFFDRLGETVFHIYLDGPKVVALGAAVLRTIPNTDGKEQKVWYLCDLKVHPEATHRDAEAIFAIVPPAFANHQTTDLEICPIDRV